MTLHNGTFRPPLGSASRASASLASAPGEAVARETSMDDILASIRRIIADDDALPLSNSARAAQRAAAAPAMARPPAPSAARPAAARHQEARSPEARSQESRPQESRPPEARPVVSSAGSAEPGATPLAPQQRPAPAARSAPSPAPTARPRPDRPPPDAAPRDGATALKTQAPVQPAPPQPTPAQQAPTLKLRDFAPSVGTPTRPPQPAPVANLAEARLKASARAETHEAFRELASKPVRDESFGLSGAAAAAVQTPRLALEAARPAEETPRRDRRDQPLVSSQSGEKIAASFSTLAENLALRDPELVERLMREILRPMLKDWLDAHLPDLVEKLVRAEIERLTRG